MLETIRREVKRLDRGVPVRTGGVLEAEVRDSFHRTVASIGTNRLLVDQLWNTTAHDPLTFAVAIGVILLVGLAACYIPAARAVRVDPMAALRSE